MLCLPRLAVVAFTLVSIPAAATAQRIPFPDGKGWVGHGLTLPITWEGKPALLVAGRMAAGPEGAFVSYDTQFQPPIIPTPVFRVAAAYFIDTRPCAVQPWAGGPTSEPCLNVGYDDGGLGSFGGLAPDCTLLWTGGGLWHTRLGFEGWRSFSNKPYHIQYILSPQTVRRTACPGDGPGRLNTGPEFTALVLVIEGLGT